MADADALIAAALQQSECLPENTDAATWSTATLDCDALVTIVYRCLAQIQATIVDEQLDITIPATFTAPTGVAARHRVGSQLATALKTLGYAGDCGYNHFLYPSEKETRHLLTWLVGKLPHRTPSKQTSSSDAVTAATTTTATTYNDAVLPATTSISPTQLQHVFHKWTRERTLHVLPNRTLPQLRGFEALPLATAPLHLPWLHSLSQQQQQNASSDNAAPLLFDAVPQTPVALRSLSLLEALAQHQRRRHQRIEGHLDDVDRSVKSVARSDPTRTNDDDGDDNNGAWTTADAFATEKEARRATVDDVDAFNVVAPAHAAVDRLRASSSKRNPLAPVDAAQLLSTTTPPSASSTAAATANGASETATSALRRAQHAADDAVDKNDDDATLATLQDDVNAMQQRIATLRVVVDDAHQALGALEQTIDAATQRGIVLKRQVATRQQTLAMLPEAETHIEALHTICAASTAKLVQLERDWVAQQAPLREALAARHSVTTQRKARCRTLVHEMTTMRQSMRALTTAIETKRATHASLERTLAQLPTTPNSSSNSRHVYTTRILAIIQQVHKQNAAIATVIADIHTVQKQLNAAAETLKRTEAVAEEKLYSAARAAVGSAARSTNKTTELPVVECYRRFADVRERFEALIRVVRDVGARANGVRDLENWIAQLERRDSGRHLDNVLADVESIEKENAALVETLRAQQQKERVG